MTKQPHTPTVNLGPSPWPLSHKVYRAIWALTWALFFRTSPYFMYSWRAMLLRLFGAEIGKNVRISSSATCWAPNNLKVGQGSILGPRVRLYSVAAIKIGNNVVVSQDASLCAATHDPASRTFSLVPKPITIGDSAWVAAEAFIGPGTRIGSGAIAGARSVVFMNVAPWSIVAGNPAKFIRTRILSNA